MIASSIDARVLAALRQANVHVPLDDLAAVVRAAAPAVEERIGRLREAGFDIERRPGLGYSLIAAPDRIVADDLWARLSLGEPLGLVREIIAFEETDSTNDAAAQLGRRGARGGVIVFAERQRAGRGRFGRRWESAGGMGLWFSMLLRPKFPVAQWPRLTTWAAVSVAAALEQLSSVAAAIKWPNDVHLLGRKVAGILIETGTDEDRKPFVVAGIGINANQSVNDFPPAIRDIAISMREAMGRGLDRADMAIAILRELNSRYESLADDFESVLAEAAERSSILGKWARVQAGDAAIEGIAEALNEDGHLILRLEDGTARTLSAGEVTLHRA